MDILNNHKFDEGWKNKSKNKSSNNKKQSNNNNNNNNTQNNSNSSNKSVTSNTESSFAQGSSKGFGQNRCFCCGKTGYWSKDCSKNHLPKSQWAITKGQQFMQSVTLDDNDEASVANTEVSNGTQLLNKGWVGLQGSKMLNQFDEANEMKDNIILDNGSTVDLFMNKDFVSDIAISEKPMELHTNTGTKINTQKTQVPRFGEVWYDKDAIANIFSLKNLMKEHWVKFNSRFEDAFIVESEKSGKRLNLMLIRMVYTCTNLQNCF